MIKLWPVLALSLLGSCSQPIQCDAHGMIIIPADASEKQRSELNSRNVDFMNRRLETQLGRASHYTAEALDKATGCP